MEINNIQQIYFLASWPMEFGELTKITWRLDQSNFGELVFGELTSTLLLAWYRVKFNKLSGSDKAKIERYIDSNDDEDSYT